MMNPPPTSRVVWHDLTVKDASRLRDFYTAVLGWTSQDHAMGDYSDYVLTPPTAAPPLDPAGTVFHADAPPLSPPPPSSPPPADCGAAIGICHARGLNANVPPQWLIYFSVRSVPAAAHTATSLGGKVLDGPRDMGGRQFAVIQDPAGACCALIEP